MQQRLENIAEKASTPLSYPEGKPFVTISRQYGCPSKSIADHLKDLCHAENRSWKVITKEIIETAALELNLKPQQIKYVFDAKEKTVMDDVISALSTKYYKSDRKIRKTIREIVENLAAEGHNIIIGRGGVAITNDFKGSFHVRLYAPENWRLKKALDINSGMKEVEAYRKIRFLDKKRTDLINQFSGNKFNFNKFDLQINCANFSEEQCAQIIFEGMRIRSLI